MALIWAMASCNHDDSDASAAYPHIITNESFYSDFSIQDDLVYIKCHLVVYNPYEEETYIEIFGDFEKDVQGGLLAERTLAASDEEDLNEHVFLITPGKNDIDVVFIGKNGTGTQKQDRLLPDDMKVVVVHQSPKDE